MLRLSGQTGKQREISHHQQQHRDRVQVRGSAVNLFGSAVSLVSWSQMKEWDSAQTLLSPSLLYRHALTSRHSTMLYLCWTCNNPQEGHSIWVRKWSVCASAAAQSLWILNWQQQGGSTQHSNTQTSHSPARASAPTVPINKYTCKSCTVSSTTSPSVLIFVSSFSAATCFLKTTSLPLCLLPC